MKNNQKNIIDLISDALQIQPNYDQIEIIQSRTFLREKLSVTDFTTAVISALGVTIDKLAQLRGMSPQKITVDRRLAALSINGGLYNYINGNLVQGGEIEVPVNGFFQDKNGKWMCLNGAYPHLRDGILKYFNVPHDQEALIEAISKHDISQIEKDFEEKGLCMAPMMTKEEWSAHPQGQEMEKHPIIMMDKKGEGQKGILPEMKYRPLEGVKVIDVTHVVAGPWSTRVLADHGADVISVRNGSFPFLYPAIFDESWGKKQVFLNFAIQKEKERFIELIKTADVLVWGYGPGSLDRLGLSVEALKEINPNLILTNISAYGPTGPWRNRKGWEQLSQTHSGMVEVASEGRDQKHLVGALPLDYNTGNLAAIGTIGALIQRQIHGGFYEVNAMLAKTAMEITKLSFEEEEVLGVSMDDMKKYLIDQKIDDRTIFTRLQSPLSLEKTPSFCAFGPSINGTDDAWEVEWAKEVVETKPSHYPSLIVDRGLSPFVLLGYGHEDIMLRPETV